MNFWCRRCRSTSCSSCSTSSFPCTRWTAPSSLSAPCNCSAEQVRSALPRSSWAPRFLLPSSLSAALSWGLEMAVPVSNRASQCTWASCASRSLTRFTGCFRRGGSTPIRSSSSPAPTRAESLTGTELGSISQRGTTKKLQSALRRFSSLSSAPSAARAARWGLATRLHLPCRHLASHKEPWSSPADYPRRRRQRLFRFRPKAVL
mmetsp:Transcript_5791/g.10872  ORF Transcript_5791/g.10872 Transcript_5791/m.10872 type:complete len:205 (+) Transcript_5791:663-1277(+)